MPVDPTRTIRQDIPSTGGTGGHLSLFPRFPAMHYDREDGCKSKANGQVFIMRIKPQSHQNAPSSLQAVSKHPISSTITDGKSKLTSRIRPPIAPIFLHIKLESTIDELRLHLSFEAGRSPQVFQLGEHAQLSGHGGHDDGTAEAGMLAVAVVDVGVLGPVELDLFWIGEFGVVEAYCDLELIVRAHEKRRTRDEEEILRN